MWLVYKELRQRLERARGGERTWLEIVCIDVAVFECNTEVKAMHFQVDSGGHWIRGRQTNSLALDLNRMNVSLDGDTAALKDTSMAENFPT